MRKELKNRLAKLEPVDPADTFRIATIRGNFPDEQAAEFKRLLTAGEINDGDFCIYQSYRSRQQAQRDVARQAGGAHRARGNIVAREPERAGNEQRATRAQRGPERRERRERR